MSDRDAPVNGRLRGIRDRHFECYLDLARMAEDLNAGEDLLGVFDAELANFRSALEWGLSTRRPETVAFATSLAHYWMERKLFIEGRQILDRVLRASDLYPTDRIDALLTAGRLATEQGDYPAARDHCAMARQLAASAGDRGRQLRAAVGLGWMSYFMLETSAAVEAFTEALELGEGVSASERAQTLRGLAWARAVDEGSAVALDLHRQARQLLEEASDPGLPNHYLIETNLLVQHGYPQEAAAVAEKALALARSGIGPLIWALEATAHAAQALGDREVLRRAVDDGIAAARAVTSDARRDFMGPEGWEGSFLERLARDAMAHGEVGSAREAIEGALRVLDEVDVPDAHDAAVRARVLGARARLAEDDGELDLAHELYRQAIVIYTGSSAHSHAETLAAVGHLFADHGDLAAGLRAAKQAVDLVERAGGQSVYLRIDLCVMSDDLEAALGHTAPGLEAVHRDSRGELGLLLRRYALFAEVGRLDEALATADEVAAAGLSDAGVFLGRARIRVALGDHTGARSDLADGASVAQVEWAQPQLQLATTLARLALLEGRRYTATALWSAVQEYRSANQRLAPRLSQRFEEPLRELEVTRGPATLDSRAALDALRSVVSDEFAELAPDGGE